MNMVFNNIDSIRQSLEWIVLSRVEVVINGPNLKVQGKVVRHTDSHLHIKVRGTTSTIKVPWDTFNRLEVL